MGLKLVRKEEQPDMLGAALGYLKRGWSVLPICAPSPGGGCRQHGDGCKSPGKTPLVPWKEYQEHLPSEDDVRLWYRRWPTANIGLATGAVSGVVVIDADSESAIQFVLGRGEGELASAPMVTTGKGAHWYVEHPGEDVHNFARKWPGVDFRGDGGYVLVPPSLHYSGRRYAWHATPEDMGGLPEAPAWLMDALRHKPTAGNGDRSDTGERLDLDAFVEGIGEGSRQDKLFRLACKLRGDAMSLEYARLMLLGAAGACKPPYPEDETLAIVERVWATYPEGVPDHRHGVFLDEDDGSQGAPEEGTEPEDDPYPFIPYAEFMAVEDPPEEWLIDGLVADGALNWFYASSGVGKTLIAAWFMLHIAAGRPLQGRGVVQSNVMFVSQDSGARQVRKYLRKLAKGGGFPAELPIWINPRPTDLSLIDGTGLKNLKQRVERIDPRLIVIDSCERMVPSKDYKTIEYIFLQQFIAYCRDRDTAVIMIDHCNKARGADGSKPKPTMDRIFGSQAKQRDIDVAIEFNGTFKNGQAVSATFTKCRDQAPPDFEVTIDQHAPDAMTLVIEADTTYTELSDEERRVFRMLDEERGALYTTGQIVSATGLNQRSVQRYLKELMVRGLVLSHEKTTTKGRQVSYSTKPDPDVVGTPEK